MKRAPAIDTLRYARRLADTGMNRETANTMAHALNEELEDRLLTKTDLAQALAPIHTKLTEIDQRFDAADAKIDSKAEALDAKIEALDANVDVKFGALDAKVDVKFGALDAKFDAQFGALDAKFDAQFGALDAKVDARFDSLFKYMVFGFSTMFLALSSAIALGVIHFERHAPPAVPVHAVVEQPAEPQRGAGVGAAHVQGAAVERPTDPLPGR